jgi:putative polysaccharide biosynthesis protein
VKPVTSRGGKGAERWDLVSESFFRNPCGDQLSGVELAARLCRRARKRALLVQPRLIAHQRLRRLSTGALCTVRVLTCVNEHGKPEVVEATFRMSIGRNDTVDNFHAGGIAAEVCLDTGVLGKASNLGFDARLGWLSIHPNTGVMIEGLRLPCWAEVKALAVRAHRAFDDRILIGWDIAIVDDGPILIEGNGSPDLDLHQRPAARGLVESRAGHLLARHLKVRMG